ncbi:MAG: dinitrogenase iron-molybdenum cofactor biosynthesis protein [bacterium]|nr:dinitrogenase iron-molybdenum cofactor biosynthesis protein [bacterium]
MKIAITAQGKDPDSEVDPLFGRAKGFIIYDNETGDYTYIDNLKNLNAKQGAGIQSSKNIIDAGAEVLITGDVGPKAFRALNSADVEIYTGAKGRVRESIDLFKNGKLKKTADATVEGHH